jgi:galactitol-specific phosphotransferase system IIC component
MNPKLEGTTMKLYLIAVVMTVTSVTVIVNVCMLRTSATRVVPVNLYQLK